MAKTMPKQMDEKEDGIKVYRRLVGMAMPHWKIFLLGILALVANGLTDTAFAWLMKPLMDEGFVARDQQAGLYIPLAIVVIFTLRGITSFVASYCISWVGRRVVDWCVVAERSVGR